VPAADAPNPFRFGALALDEAFADRREELASLKQDALAGQDVVLLAPRRLGKTSLVWRVAQELIAERVLLAQVDLMTTPTLGRFAEKLAQAIHEDIASPLFRARERLRVFQGLRITPAVSVNPEDASLSFTFTGAASTPDLLATVERLLELPGQLAGERGRRVALVLDEFQEVTAIDAGLPRLMRAVFQRQPEVAHIYLGSHRHAMENLFGDENEPFWRSARRMELGPIAPAQFAPFLAERFASTARPIDPTALGLLLEITQGHPYATQELCYFAWQRGSGGAVSKAQVHAALEDVLRSEDSHFTEVWDRLSSQQRTVLAALSREPAQRPLSGEYRRRHNLPTTASMQRALQSLSRSELIARRGGVTSISEPFLGSWLHRRQI
jgi:hypothetical protein